MESHSPIRIRGWRRGKLIFDEPLPLSDETDFEKLVKSHMERLGLDQPHMLEFEFLDAPTEARFLRFGTDPTRMREPISLSLDELHKVVRKGKADDPC